MEQDDANPRAEHLCVLVHGLWGNPNHMAYIAKALRDKHSDEKLHILVPKRNSGSFTYDGIELGGERVCQEIEEEIENLARKGQIIKRLSIVGYSLGGLVSRYAIGLLESKGVFNEVEPVNFTTFATPHLGVRTPLRGYHNHVWNVLGARTLSKSGRQLFTIDKFRDTSRPLLAVLADPNSIFMTGLSHFKRRTLYTNIVNDRSAVYYTTGISRTDPFTDLDAVRLKYLEGYEDVILDPKAPVEPKVSDVGVLPSFAARLAAKNPVAFSGVPLTIAMLLFIPIGAVAFLINSLIQSIRSSRRIRLHEAGKGGVEVSNYRVPVLINNMREAVEDVYENLNSALSQEYLAHGSEEKAASAPLLRNSSQQLLASDSGAEVDEKNALSTVTSMTSLDDALQQEKAEKGDLAKNEKGVNAPTLALSACQFAMIQALDELGWRKYPVHIHKSNHSHAAMIVRMPKESFSEGKVVLRHWLEEEFIA